MMLSIDSVRPTVATASAPSLETQTTSTTANTDSRTISITIGIASRRMARPMEPSVKSCREPRRASWTDLQNVLDGSAADAADWLGTSREALMAVHLRCEVLEIVAKSGPVGFFRKASAPAQRLRDADDF